jgi:hypothetical protein
MLERERARRLQTKLVKKPRSTKFVEALLGFGFADRDRLAGTNSGY